MLKGALVVVSMMALMPSAAQACSVTTSDEFVVDRHAMWTAPPSPGVLKARLALVQLRFGTCDGLQFATLDVSGMPYRKLRHFGYLIRPISGFNGGGPLPAPHPLAPDFWDDTAHLNWMGADIVPDADGHVRWRLEVTPVSRSGIHGTPFEVCAATDGSCPPLLPCGEACPVPASP
jgi:hypothetical protein